VGKASHLTLKVRAIFIACSHQKTPQKGTHQSRKEKGMIRACLTMDAALALRNTTVNAYVADLICDPWAATHIALPFFLYCFMQNWPIVFLITGLNELGESLLRVVAGGGGGLPLIEDSEGGGVGESLTGALVDDWLTQGGIALILGGLFMYHFETEALLSLKTWRRRRGQWWYYLFIILLRVITVYPFSVGLQIPPVGNITLPRIADFTEDKSLVWVGFAGMVLFNGVLVLQAWALEPYFSIAWRKEAPWKRPYFWAGLWVISSAFEIQAMWDYFYSSAIQTWLIAGIVAVYLIAIAVARHKWLYFVTRFDSWAELEPEKSS
jgi:hypothetical protein